MATRAASLLHWGQPCCDLDNLRVRLGAFIVNSNLFTSLYPFTLRNQRAIIIAGSGHNC